MKRMATGAAAIALLAAIAAAHPSRADAQDNAAGGPTIKVVPPPGGLAPKPGRGAGVHGQHHPIMTQAIGQLQQIKARLNSDDSEDRGGHRAQAIELIDQAIEHLRQGIAAEHP